MASIRFALQHGSFLKGLRRTRTSSSVFCRLPVARSRKTTAAAYDRHTGIYTSDRRDIVFPEAVFLDFVTFVLRRKGRNNKGVALVDGTTGRELTFDQVEVKTRALAADLRHLGVAKGDVVLILAPNSILYPLAVMAVASIGAVAATPGPVGSAKDIEFQAKLTNTKMVITTKELLVKTRELRLQTMLIDSDGSFCLAERPETPVKSRASSTLDPGILIHRDDPAAILFSSGTAGMSKAVVLSHANIVSQIMQLGDKELYETRLCRRDVPYDVPLCALPMSHIFGLVAVTLKHLFLGNKLVILPGFDLRAMLAAIESFQVSHLYVVPPVVFTLAKLLQKHDGDHNLTSLRAILCGGAPLGEEQVCDLCRCLPNSSFYQLYGMTEAAGALTFNDTANSGSTASVGRLLSNVEAKVLDVVSGVSLPPSRQGELLLRSPTIMIGYMNNAEATKLSKTSDGWLRTGDLVYFDDVGNLFVMDRIKELIKFKTLQVAPAEIEALLLTHPQILDAAVAASKDELCGEVPIAFVVPCLDGELTEQEVRAFVDQIVAPYKRIRRVIFVDAIPKTPSGKILRKDLKNFDGKSAS